jgi:hypothetical protein
LAAIAATAALLAAVVRAGSYNTTPSYVWSVAVPPVHPVNVVPLVPVYVTVDPSTTNCPEPGNVAVLATLMTACGSVAPSLPAVMLVTGNVAAVTAASADAWLAAAAAVVAAVTAAETTFPCGVKALLNAV